MSTAGFRVKPWVISGNGDDSEGIHLLKTQTEKVLGMLGDIEKGEFFYIVRINFSPKYKGMHTEPNPLCSELNLPLPPPSNLHGVILPPTFTV